MSTLKNDPTAAPEPSTASDPLGAVVERAPAAADIPPAPITPFHHTEWSRQDWWSKKFAWRLAIGAFQPPAPESMKALQAAAKEACNAIGHLLAFQEDQVAPDLTDPFRQWLADLDRAGEALRVLERHPADVLEALKRAWGVDGARRVKKMWADHGDNVARLRAERESYERELAEAVTAGLWTADEARDQLADLEDTRNGPNWHTVDYAQLRSWLREDLAAHVAEQVAGADGEG